MMTNDFKSLLTNSILERLSATNLSLFDKDGRQIGEQKLLSIANWDVRWGEDGATLIHKKVNWTFPNGEVDAHGWRVTRGELVLFSQLFLDPIKIGLPRSRIRIEPVMAFKFKCEEM